MADNNGVLETWLAIIDIARTVNDFRPLGQTMELICRQAARLPGCDWVSISVLSEDGQRTEGSFGVGFTEAFLQWRERNRANMNQWSPLFEVASTGQPILIEDLTNRPDLEILSEGARIQGFRSIGYFPIIASGRVLGTMNTYGIQPRAYTDEHVELMHTVARLAGVAVHTSLIADTQRAAAARLQALTEQLESRNVELDSLAQAQTRLVTGLLEAAEEPVNVACRLLAAEIGASVMVAESDGRPRAFAGDPEARERMASLLARSDTPRKLAANQVVERGETSIFRIGYDQLLGMLAVHPPLPEGPDIRHPLVHHAVGLIGFSLETERADRSIRMHALPGALHSLLTGRLSPRQVEEAFAALGFAGGAMRMAVIACPDDQAASRIARQLTRSPRSLGLLTAAAESNRVLALIEDDSLDRIRISLEQLLELARAGDRPVGVSDPFSEIADLGRAVEQSRTSVMLGARIGICTYDQLGPTTELLREMPMEGAVRFVERVLGPVLALDEEKTSSLISTVAAYLRHRGSLRAASAELNVHPNTVQYRLGRVAELTGLDLHDPYQLGLIAVAVDWNELVATG